jgi:hypothetical protein
MLPPTDFLLGLRSLRLVIDEHIETSRVIPPKHHGVLPGILPVRTSNEHFRFVLCWCRMNHRETSIRSLKKKEFAGEHVSEAPQMRPAVPAIGYTGFLPGLQGAVGAPFPALAKMSNSYCHEYNSRAREARTTTLSTSAAASSMTPVTTSPGRSVPRTNERGPATATTRPPGHAGGYTGYRPGEATSYGVRRS